MRVLPQSARATSLPGVRLAQCPKPTQGDGLQSRVAAHGLSRLLVLPPLRARNGNGKKQLPAVNLLALEQTSLTPPAHQLHALSLALVRTALGVCFTVR